MAAGSSAACGPGSVDTRVCCEAVEGACPAGAGERAPPGLHGAAPLLCASLQSGQAHGKMRTVTPHRPPPPSIQARGALWKCPGLSVSPCQRRWKYSEPQETEKED